MKAFLLVFVLIVVHCQADDPDSNHDDEFSEFNDPEDTSTSFMGHAPPENDRSGAIRLPEASVEAPEAGSGDASVSIDEDLEGEAPAPPPTEFKEDEEFEGFVMHTMQTPNLGDSENLAVNTNTKPELKIAKVPHHVFRSWDNYHIELVLLAIILVYLVNFIVGRGTNSSLANAWFTAHKELLEANFSMVGDDGQAQPGTGTLAKETESVYSLWCSGRVCCEGMLVELRLLKRQCLVSVLLNWLKPANDTLIVKIVMDECEMDGWVLAVGRKRTLAALAKDHVDLATYSQDRRGQRFQGLPEPFLVLSETNEATTAALNSTVNKLIADHADSIDYFYFSDQYSGPKPPQDEPAAVKPDEVQKVLIFSFHVGQKGTTTVADMETVLPLFNLIFYMIEKVRRIRLGKEAKAKSERARQRMRDTHMKIVHTQRQEAAQNRRDEQRRAAKERIMTEEDPDKARRLEEKEQRKENKRKQPKMKMLKVKGM